MASSAYGTLTTLDSLAATNQTIGALGENAAYEAIAAILAAHNRIWREMVMDLADVTTDRQRIYGGDANMVMDAVDQFGRADAQKQSAGTTVGFPLRLNQIALQWTRKFFENTTGAQLAANVQGVMRASLAALQRDMKRAIFLPTNVTFNDILVDNVALAVKRLVNADSAEIPSGPNGESFDAATHTHYLATASFTADDLDDLLEAVVEHYAAGNARVYFNRASEAAVRDFDGFTPYLDARLVAPSTDLATRAALDANVVLNNRAIGIYSAAGVSAEVWVKPWIPANYAFAYVDGAPKPLALRERRPGTADLQLVADDESYPLRARSWEQEYGLAVWNRTNGAVMRLNNGTYAAPTIT